MPFLKANDGSNIHTKWQVGPGEFSPFALDFRVWNYYEKTVKSDNQLHLVNILLKSVKWHIS